MSSQPTVVFGPPRPPSDNSPERFKTKWSDHTDIAAARWAAEHKLSFVGRDGWVKKIGPDAYLLRWQGAGINTRLLRSENEKFDQSERLRFMADLEIDTGTLFLDNIDWVKNTRGEKLRTLEKEIEDCVANLALSESTKVTLGKRFAENPSDQDVRHWLGLVTEDVNMRKGGLKLAKEMRDLVLEEVNEGWTWKVGLERQKELWETWHDAANRHRSFFSGVNSQSLPVGFPIAGLVVKDARELENHVFQKKRGEYEEDKLIDEVIAKEKSKGQAEDNWWILRPMRDDPVVGG